MNVIQTFNELGKAVVLWLLSLRLNPEIISAGRATLPFEKYSPFESFLPFSPPPDPASLSAPHMGRNAILQPSPQVCIQSLQTPGR